MATKLGLYNACLAKLKQRPIASLSSSDPARYGIDLVYDDVLAWMLEQGDWNFAQRNIGLEPSVDVATEYGFQNAFEVPDDFCRLISISSNPYMWPPMIAGQFNYDGGNQVWEADCNPLFVSYVSNDTSYGLNLGIWTATFADAVAYQLAERVAPALTNLPDADWQRLVQMSTRALRNAKTKDALNQGNQEPPPGKLTMSRRNYRARTLWER
jgi:hypothetical protein